jgi:hypothetical protein
MKAAHMIYEHPIVFHSQGVPLVGRVLRNTDSLTDRQRAVVVMGSWLTVKEQMAATLALPSESAVPARRLRSIYILAR